MAQEILITGASGMVGRDLTALLLERSDAVLHLLLHQRGAEAPTADLLRDVFEIEPTPDLLRRVRVLAGDVTVRGLGLSPEARASLGGITDLVHGAATTRFDLPLEETRRINVEGAKNIVELALDLRRLERFAYLSTAFVAGKRNGPILESEREHDCGFVNTYEQSKYEAEGIIEQVRGTLPVSVYRLSTILGDSKTGKVTRFTAPHMSVHIMYLGLAAMVAGDPNCFIDLMPSDYSAEVLFELFTGHFSPGLTYHLTAGAAKSYTLQEIIAASFEALGELDPEWARRRYPQPVIASGEAFDLLLDSAAQTTNPRMQAVVKVLNTFAGQFSHPKSFSVANTLAALPDYERNLPDVRDYYTKVVAYCLATKWRRHA